MPEYSKYWVAGHITGIFEIQDTSINPLEKGSRGAGFCINKGVYTEAQFVDSDHSLIDFDGVTKKPEEALITATIIDKFVELGGIRGIQISHTFEIPMSAGFGASAAGALGTAFALNELFELELPIIKLFQIAHIAEVQNRSGLGDIIALFQGGLELRIKAGAPGIGKTLSLQNENDLQIATVHLGSISTSSVLSNPFYRKLINQAGQKYIDTLKLTPSFTKFGELSERFTKSAGLLSSKLEQLFVKISKPLLKGQIMLGEGIFVLFSEEKQLDDINSVKFDEHDICSKTVVKF
ncbi:MAG: pantoate kinase [Promethearchaeota archaeon]